MTITGTNFLSASTVTYNGVAHAATYVSATQLTITLSAGDQGTVGSYAVVVTNPGPGGGASNALSFTVNNPAPVLAAHGITDNGTTSSETVSTPSLTLTAGSTTYCWVAMWNNYSGIASTSERVSDGTHAYLLDKVYTKDNSQEYDLSGWFHENNTGGSTIITATNGTSAQPHNKIACEEWKNGNTAYGIDGSYAASQETSGTNPTTGTSPLRDPPALPGRQQKFDSSRSTWHVNLPCCGASNAIVR